MGFNVILKPYGPFNVLKERKKNVYSDIIKLWCFCWRFVTPPESHNSYMTLAPLCSANRKFVLCTETATFTWNIFNIEWRWAILLLSHYLLHILLCVRPLLTFIALLACQHYKWYVSASHFVWSECKYQAAPPLKGILNGSSQTNHSWILNVFSTVAQGAPSSAKWANATQPTSVQLGFWLFGHRSFAQGKTSKLPTWAPVLVCVCPSLCRVSAQHCGLWWSIQLKS